MRARYVEAMYIILMNRFIWNTIDTFFLVIRVQPLATFPCLAWHLNLNLSLFRSNPMLGSKTDGIYSALTCFAIFSSTYAFFLCSCSP